MNAATFTEATNPMDGGSDSGDLVASNDGTLHRSTGEQVFTETGERTKMKCGAILPGTGHPNNKFAVKDHRDRDKLCNRCFDQ